MIKKQSIIVKIIFLIQLNNLKQNVKIFTLSNLQKIKIKFKNFIILNKTLFKQLRNIRIIYFIIQLIHQIKIFYQSKIKKFCLILINKELIQ